MRAERISQPIHLDGRLDEPAWAAAPVFSDFVQNFPKEGEAPTERTELRVLYDDSNLYVGVTCFDQHPEQILRNLGRRDNPPASDSVAIGIDSAHDHRTAYAFGVNAGGVLVDGLFFEGSNFTSDWDAVWDARAAMRPDGWSAEFVIPLSILRFKPSPEMVWGFAVRREVAHKHETDDSVLIPRAANQFVQRFGHLTGLEDLKPRPDLEIAPYLAARAILRPQFSDATLPHPRLVDPLTDLGADFKAALSSHLILNGALNPDFGQVEADQIILNLTTYEPFRPEKRPLFVQGMDLFQPVGGTNAQQLFYSRRIGLNQPIFAAAKVSGSVAQGFDVGVLDAVVGGVSQGRFWDPTHPQYDPSASVTDLESRPDRRLAWSPTQPFTFGPNDAYPESPIVPENYFVAVGRKHLLQNATVGGTFTAATPLLRNNCPDQILEGYSPTTLSPACLAHGGNAGGLDWNVQSKNADWQFYGQVDGSQEVGGPAQVRLFDGTLLRPGDTGFGTYLDAGKVGGEPFRFDVWYEYESPRLDLNALGYLRNQNNHNLQLSPRLFWTEKGPFQNLGIRFHQGLNYSADGRWIYRGGNTSLNADAVLPGFHYMGCEVGRDGGGYEIREIQYAGVALERRPTYYFVCWGQTDRNRIFSVSPFAVVGWNPKAGASPAAWSAAGGGEVVWRPHSRLETRLGVNFGQTPWAAHFVPIYDQNGNQTISAPFLFGDLESETLSWTLRQLLVLTPRLTLQAYAQLFSGYGRYKQYYTASPGADGRVHYADMVPVDPNSDPVLAPMFSDPNFHTSALALNVVARWEYRLGSTLFLVWSHSQGELPWAYPPPLPPAELRPDNLFRGGAVDTFLVKWSYWWSS